MKYEIRLFFTALMFLTRIPCPSWVGFSEDLLNNSSRYFPLVGAVVGLFGALAFWLAQFIFPLPIAILLSMVATVRITGAFHEDGLSDACDGFGGGRTRGDILKIMKDSRVGAYGVIGIGLALALKFFSLAAVPASQIPVTIVAGHTVSRFFTGMFIYTHEYVQEDLLSKVKPLARKMSFSSLIVSGLWCVVPLLLLPPLKAVAVVVLLAAAQWITGRYFKRRLGGYTGDCLGASQQVFEILIYLIVASLL